jgi:hypothetical protein
VIVLAWVCFGCAAVPALLYLWNSFLFREPPPLANPECDQPAGEQSLATASSQPAISVLIPARNEELGIAACVESVLASQHVEIEVIVLDDHSTDRTAEIVREIAAKDSRLRIESAPPLPEGWCGKQAACFTLSKMARHDILTFLDADVRLEPDALARMVRFLQQSSAALVSGFPRQETGTVLEKLLIPLINWVLLAFLPLWAMRRFCWSAFGAGCGQWFMTTRQAYEAIGGHAAVKASLHDGLTLPRAYRRAGFMTDICDASRIATCRMYRSASQVWNGLAKNAREGMAATGQIGFWTAMLLGGQVLWLATGSPEPVVSVLLVFGPPLHAAWRFGQPLVSGLLHPLGVFLLVAIQWYALVRTLIGKPVGWKGRNHPHRRTPTHPDPRVSSDRLSP